MPRGDLPQVGRSALVVVAFTLAGLVSGLAYAVAVPALWSASALVRVPASSDPQTDVAIALSAPVLVPGSRAAWIDLPFNTLQRRVTVTSPTTGILQVTAQARTGRRAALFANAEAASFVAYMNDPSVVAVDAVIALGMEEKSIQAKTSALDAEIKDATRQEASEPKNSALAATTLALLGSLWAEVANLKLESDVVDNNVAALKARMLSQSSFRAELLRGATTAAGPSALRQLGLEGCGALMGLAIGLLVARVRVSWLDRRLPS